MKYIGDNPQRGVQYNWKQIRKELHRAGVIPAEFYDPCTAPLESAQWFVEVSERSLGKTNSWLLLGLVMFKLYGTVTIYGRSKRDMIAPKNSESLYHVIKENHYIERITNGDWNDITYKSKRWYLCNTDEDGSITKICEKYCTRMISLDESGNIKSSFNEPMGDLFLYDEFIPINPRYVVQNEFVILVDVCSTIFRLRECCKVVLLANTLDKYNQYFHDLEIFEQVSAMQISENCTVTTSGGTKVYVELLGAPKQYRTKKERWTTLFAGFNNPELVSVTGKATWAVRMYQHIPYTDEGHETETLYNKIYIYAHNKYLRLDIVHHSDLGTCIYVHWATKIYEDSIIMTTEPKFDKRFVWGLGSGSELGRYLKSALEQHRFYFAANDVGAFFENYLISCGYITKNLL